MAGLCADFFPLNVYNLIADNIKLNEIRQNTEEAKLYGVDKLITNPNESMSFQ